MLFCFDIEDIKSEADALAVAKELRTEVIQVKSYIGRGKSQRLKSCQSKLVQFCDLCRDEKWKDPLKAISKSIMTLEEARADHTVSIYGILT